MRRSVELALLLAVDLALVALAIAAAARLGLTLPAGLHAGLPLALALAGCYATAREVPLPRMAAAAGGALLLLALGGAMAPAPAPLLLWTALLTVLLFAGRRACRAWLGRRAGRALLVGPAPTCDALSRDELFTASSGLTAAAAIHVDRDCDVDGAALRALHGVQVTGADAIVLCGAQGAAFERRLADLAAAAGIDLLRVIDCDAVPDVRPLRTGAGDSIVLGLTRPGPRALDLAIKRALDVLLASVLLIVTLPLLALIALAVRLDSRGAVVFVQERLGQGGRPFRILKFRTMRQSAAPAPAELSARDVYRGDGRLFKVPDDPRVTRVGRVLRRTSLDELPQLLNVLRGDMSLVGPRPPLPCEVARYGDDDRRRLDVRPGITGPWQVSGRNLVMRFEDVVRIEREYVARWSLGRDLAILLRTIPVVLRMRGSM